MKASIKVLSNGNVELSYDSPLTGERETEVYTCPKNGGYVRTKMGSQICDGLSNRGNTLTCSSNGEELAKLIRKEYRKFREGYVAMRENWR